MVIPALNGGRPRDNGKHQNKRKKTIKEENQSISLEKKLLNRSTECSFEEKQFAVDFSLKFLQNINIPYHRISFHLP